jgi:biotin carboxylase
MPANERFFWIIGGGLLQVPLVAEVKKLGYRTIVSDMSPECVCAKQADIFIAVNIFDIRGHIEHAQRLKSSGKDIAAVLAAGIDAPETMAVLAKSLGLPSVEPEIAHTVNNKDKFRETMKRLGYPVPRFSTLGRQDMHRLGEIIDAIGFPLIVKNTNSSGSRGTKIFRSPDLDDIRRTIETAVSVSRSGLALLEECWEGEEQTVETLFDINSRFHPCFITDRFFDKRDGYAIETGLRNPSALPPETQEEMFSLAREVATSLGIKIGAAKYDMMLTKDGPRIIEMTARLSGGFDCQYLVPAATGKNVLRAAALTALGEPFPAELLENTKGRVGLTGVLWPKPGRITRINGLDEAQSVPGYEHVFLRYNVGDIVEPYTDCTKRACFIIVTGKTEDEAMVSLENIKNIIRIETEEAP